MIVFIPLADGQMLPSMVALGICAQTLPTDLIPLVTPGHVRSNHDEMDRHKRAEKLRGECAGRNKAKEFLTKYYPGQEYVVMMDSDMVIDDMSAFVKMRNAMVNDSRICAVSLPKQAEGSVTHWDLAVVMYRVSWLMGYTFNVDDRLHLCNTVSEYLGDSCMTLRSRLAMCHEISRKIT